jgi:hypothetical protein
MNKRIKKKRMKLRNLRIGDRIYTHKEIAMINKAHIGFLGLVYSYDKIKEPKLSRPRVKALINYIYKNRMKHYKQHPLSYKHLRFARHLNESDATHSENANMNDPQNMDYRIKAYEEYGAHGPIEPVVLVEGESKSEQYNKKYPDFPLKAKRQLVGFDENGNTIWEDIKRDKEIREQNQ